MSKFISKTPESLNQEPLTAPVPGTFTAKSRVLATMLALAMATTLTLAQAVVMPSPAEAGVFSSIRGAAKKVGGAVVTTAKGIGEAGKAVGGVGRQIGVGVGSHVKRGAVAVGHQINKLPLTKDVINVGRAIREHF